MNNYGDKLTDKAYEYAKKYNLKITDGTKGWNDEGDAFRHAYMQADIAVKSTLGLSKTAGDVHETLGDIQHRQDPREKNMDKWNNEKGREIAKEINQEYNLRERISMIQSGKMDDVIAEKVSQRLKKGDLITHPSDTRKYDDRTHSQKFDDEIRERHRNMVNERNRRILGKSKSAKSSQSSGGGRWVTINGAHVYLEK